MTDRITIRPEKEADIKRISKIIKSAFDHQPHSNQKEHLLVADLRKSNALSVSLVAESNGHILGHIAFSKVLINDKALSSRTFRSRAPE